MPNAESDVFRVTPQFRDTDSNTRFQNVFYCQAFVLNDPADATIVTDFEELLDDIFGTVAGIMGENVDGENKNITNVTKRERIGISNFTFTGTNAVSELLPPQCAAEILIPLKTVGRTGRKYLGGICEDQQASGIWIAGALTALGNFATKMVQVFVATSTNAYVYGIARFAPGGALTSFDSYQDLVPRVKSQVHTQRRRTAGVGLT